MQSKCQREEMSQRENRKKNNSDSRCFQRISMTKMIGKKKREITRKKGEKEEKRNDWERQKRRGIEKEKKRSGARKSCRIPDLKKRLKCQSQ